VEEPKKAVSAERPAEELGTKFHIGKPIDPQRLEQERQKLDELNRKPFFKRILGFSKFTGPAYIQSAVTLGAGTAGGCLIAGSQFGYRLLWVQPLAMLLGMFMFFAMAKQAVLVRRRPYEAMSKELHFAFALLFGLSALLSTVIWHFPQYSLAGDATNDMAGLVTGKTNPIPAPVLGLVFLGFSIFVTWNYGKGLRGIKIYEKILKVMVWVIVAAFALVVLKTGVNWKELFAGLVPRLPKLPDGSFDREQAILMIALLGATVGVNMVFLYPYSLLARGWTKEHNRLAYFDLTVAMFLPFVLATGFVVLATSNTLHRRGVVETGNNPGDKAVVVNVGSISAESNITVSFDVILRKPLASDIKSVSCEAEVTSKELAPQKSDDPDTPAVGDATVTVLGQAMQPVSKGKAKGSPPLLVVANRDKLVTDRDGNRVPTTGDTIRYDVKIENNGEKPLTGLVFRARPDDNTELVARSVQSRTVTRSAVEATRVLAPVVGAVFGRVMFGIGMLGIALSSITVHMLMCAFILSEMFGIDATGWKYRLMVLTPAIGVFGVAWKVPFGVGVFCSALCVIFLPMAYICFMVLHNKRSYMGEAMPRGAKRLFWNAGMALAILVVTASAIVSIAINYGDLKSRLQKPKAKVALVERPRIGS
jgi:uncharacterized repeat protein (TIGR01451 family)